MCVSEPINFGIYFPAEQVLSFPSVNRKIVSHFFLIGCMCVCRGVYVCDCDICSSLFIAQAVKRLQILQCMCEPRLFSARYAIRCALYKCGTDASATNSLMQSTPDTYPNMVRANLYKSVPVFKKSTGCLQHRVNNKHKIKIENNPNRNESK